MGSNNNNNNELQYEEILFNWDRTFDKFMFMSWVKLICGHDEGSLVYQQLNDNVNSKSDQEAFIVCYDGDTDNIEEVTKSYLSGRGRYLSA